MASGFRLFFLHEFLARTLYVFSFNNKEQSNFSVEVCIIIIIIPERLNCM